MEGTKRRLNDLAELSHLSIPNAVFYVQVNLNLLDPLLRSSTWVFVD
jgi:hypothetical protein